MSRSNWDDELAKIDRQLESISDAALQQGQPPAKAGASAPGVAAAPAKVKPATSSLGVFARLVLAVLLGIGMLFWPYPTQCGIGLAGYLGATVVVVAAGVWSSIWTWRHRASQAHVLSLLLIVWGLLLGAQQVLPRVGYAVPDAAHPALWMCP